MYYGPESEANLAIYAYLSGDGFLANNAGMNPSVPGTSRRVDIYNEVIQDARLPYIRIENTDSVPIEDEPMSYEDQQSCFRVFFQVQVFSSYEPEILSIMGRVRYLLQNRIIATSHYWGHTYLEGSVCGFDISDTARVVRHGSMRIRVDLEPKAQ